MIQSIGKADTKTWWEIARKDPKARYFHTPSWLEIAQQSSPLYQNASLIGCLDNGTQFVLPLCSYQKRWPFKRLSSVFDMCYGGLIAEKDVPSRAFLDIQKHIPMNMLSSFSLTETPLSSYTNPLEVFETSMHTTCLLHLQNRSFDEIFRGFSKSRREDYRRGAKAGVTVRKADLSNLTAEFDQFYSICTQTIDQRWKDNALSLIFPRDFYSKIAELYAKQPENITLWFAELDGKPISTALNFQWNGNVDGWAMASLPEYFKLKPTVVLITEMIRDAINQSFKLYDLGPNLGKDSVADFKRRFGAEVVPYKIWQHNGLLFEQVEKLKR